MAAAVRTGDHHHQVTSTVLYAGVGFCVPLAYVCLYAYVAHHPALLGEPGDVDYAVRNGVRRSLVSVVAYPVSAAVALAPVVALAAYVGSRHFISRCSSAIATEQVSPVAAATRPTDPGNGTLRRCVDIDPFRSARRDRPPLTKPRRATRLCARSFTAATAPFRPRGESTHSMPSPDAHCLAQPDTPPLVCTNCRPSAALFTPRRRGADSVSRVAVPSDREFQERTTCRSPTRRHLPRHMPRNARRPHRHRHRSIPRRRTYGQRCRHDDPPVPSRRGGSSGSSAGPTAEGHILRSLRTRSTTNWPTMEPTTVAARRTTPTLNQLEAARTPPRPNPSIGARFAPSVRAYQSVCIRTFSRPTVARAGAGAFRAEAGGVDDATLGRGPRVGRSVHAHWLPTAAAWISRG